MRAINKSDYFSYHDYNIHPVALKVKGNRVKRMSRLADDFHV